MSLINDALKKAQQQRTGDSPSLDALPSLGGQSPRRIARRAKPPGFNTLLLRSGIGAGLLVVILILGFLLIRNKSASTETEKPVSVAATVTPPTPAVVQRPPAAVNSFVVPIKAPPVAAPVVKPIEPEPKVEPAKTEPPPPEPVKVIAPPPRMAPAAISFIENIRVTGIRASATDSKVLMNDRVYRIGDSVEHQLGIKLVGIESTSLTFEDLQGASYTRQF